MKYSIEAKNSIKEASSACQQQNQIDELEQFTSKMSNIVYKECDSLKDSFAKINQFLTEAKHFQQKELEARERVIYISNYLLKLFKF